MKMKKRIARSGIAFCILTLGALGSAKLIPPSPQRQLLAQIETPGHKTKTIGILQ